MIAFAVACGLSCTGKPLASGIATVRTFRMANSGTARHGTALKEEVVPRPVRQWRRRLDLLHQCNKVGVNDAAFVRPDHDITGNVAEWVADCHHVDFIGVPADGSAWLAGPCTLRNVRGAGWSLIDWTTRAAQRIGHPLQQRPSHLGMRLGRDLPPDQIDLRPYSRLAAATMARLRRV